MQRPLFNFNLPLVDDTGHAQQDVQRILNLVTGYLPIIGSGSPEGVVEARQYSLYIDRDGTAGHIEYRKMQTNIAGDTTKGWVQV